MGERDREREKERSREVQIVGGLDDLVAEQRHELPRLHGEAIAEWDRVRPVRLFQVELLRVAERERVVAVAEDTERVVLLRVNAGGDDEAPAERIAPPPGP